MFGYVRPFKPNLRVCEWEAYQGAYCGLCRVIGKEYGLRFRLALSYDGAFLAILFAALSDEAAGIEQKRCTCNPLKKCRFLCGATQSLSFAAAATVLLTWYKLRDNAEDEKGLRRCKARLLTALTCRGRKKAESRFPTLAQVCRSTMQMQKQVEHNPESGLDASAEQTGKMMAGILRETAREPVARRVLETLGFQLGRWVYLMDASDDLREDLRKNNFNPLIAAFALKADASEENLRRAREYANGVLNMDAAQIAASANLLTFRRYQGVLNNILTEGLAAAQKRVLNGEKTDSSLRFQTAGLN